MELSPGQVIGNYEVLGVLGTGGMGKVYQVRHRISFRVEAMKILPDPGARPDLVERFLREIRITAALDHPNIAAMKTADMIDNRLIMVMELVEGSTLEQLLKRRRMPVDECVEYTRQSLAALSYAHSQGIIHRDIKPSNIMVMRNGNVKLMDFGIARASGDRTLTETGQAIGSLYYMSPEQIEGKTLDGRSDIYSLGITLYEMITGDRPFNGTEYQVLDAHLKQLPRNPRELNPSLPFALSECVLTALAKQASQRYQTAELFRGALATCLAAAPQPLSGVRPPVTFPQPGTPLPSNPQSGSWPAATPTPAGTPWQQPSATPTPPPNPWQQPSTPTPPPAPWPKVSTTTPPATPWQAVTTPTPPPPVPVHNPLPPPTMRPQMPSAVMPQGPRVPQGPQGAGPVQSDWPQGIRVVTQRSRWPWYLLGAMVLLLILVVILIVAESASSSNDSGRSSNSGSHAPRVNSSDGLTYVWIPAGKFTMGCSSSPKDTQCDEDEKPAHDVTLTDGFWMGRTPVTVGAYKKFKTSTSAQMPEPHDLNPGWTDDQQPMTTETWDEADHYCQWAGTGMRLPTEAEYEYAARAGTTAARYGELDDIAWYLGNSGNGHLDLSESWTSDEKQTRQKGKENGNTLKPVGQKQANAFGLYDMLGNVWEWTLDWYDEKYYAKSGDTNPHGPGPAKYHTLRGGSFLNVPADLRVSYRYWIDPETRDNRIGFRCVGQ